MTTRKTSRAAALLPLLTAEALTNLRAMHQRSLLALLGIVIGTASVIAMINIGHNAGMEALRQFKDMGTDVVVAQPPPGGEGSSTRYDANDVRRLPAAVSGVKAVAPLVLSSSRLAANGKTVYGNLVGSDTALADVARLPVAAGRFISSYDGHETFAVIGAGLARALAAPGAPLAPGNHVRIEDYLFTVVGVMADTPSNPLIPVDFNATVIVPFGSVRRILPSSDITSIVVRLAPEANPLTMTGEITDYFHTRPRKQTVEVQSARQLIAGMERQSRLFTWLLAGIGGISLLVGGIGVMNVMLMGIMERRREIGVRMAIGARPSDIRAMFLIEAIALSLVGGVTGAVVGMAAAWVFASLSEWTFAFSAWAIPSGTGIASVIGVFFGYYPAAVAAQMDPIEALRSQ